MSEAGFAAAPNGATAEPPGAAVGDAANPMLSALLGAMGNGGTFDPGSLLMSQLGSQAASDPRMAAVQWLLSQRRPGPEIEGTAEETDGPEADAARARAGVRAERARRIRELRALVKRTWAEVEALRVRNDTLAAGLGACHLCFGSDPLCAECAGQGAPGWRAPEPAAYRAYVLPALRRARAIVATRTREDAGAMRSEGAVQRALAPSLARDDGFPEQPVERPAANEERRVRA